MPQQSSGHRFVPEGKDAHNLAVIFAPCLSHISSIPRFTIKPERLILVALGTPLPNKDLCWDIVSASFLLRPIPSNLCEKRWSETVIVTQSQLVYSVLLAAGLSL